LFLLSFFAAFPSADYLLDELQGLAATCARLAAPSLGAAMRRAVQVTV
jgi:hypothetical protein